MFLNKLLSTMTVLLMFAVAGCGFSSQLPVYPVHGKIRLEGETLVGGGSIAFIPMKKQKGKTAGGEIREDGTYVLNTYSMGDGSMAGYFRVVITQKTTTEPARIPDGQEIPNGHMSGTMTVSPDALIPAVYSDPGNSPLKATVEARSNEINFDLQRKFDLPLDQRQPGVATRLDRLQNRQRIDGTRPILSQNENQRLVGQRQSLLFE